MWSQCHSDCKDKPHDDRFTLALTMSICKNNLNLTTHQHKLKFLIGAHKKRSTVAATNVNSEVNNSQTVSLLEILLISETLIEAYRFRNQSVSFKLASTTCRPSCLAWMLTYETRMTFPRRDKHRTALNVFQGGRDGLTASWLWRSEHNSLTCYRYLAKLAVPNMIGLLEFDRLKFVHWPSRSRASLFQTPSMDSLPRIPGDKSLGFRKTFRLATNK